MAAIGDLPELLRKMEPVLHREPYGFGLTATPAWLPGAFAMMAEAEGMTLVAPEALLQAAGIAHQPGWARISLTVHSDLAAVGLTAAVAAALAARGISANVIAAYHHDHIFVQWDRRMEAMAALEGLRDA